MVLRRTKIVATLGPATRTPEALTALLTAGVDVCRINCSHATADGIREAVARVRRCATELGRPVGILLDLQGPKIRTGPVPVPLELASGDLLTVVMDEDLVGSGKRVGTTYVGLAADVRPGDQVLFADGALSGVVASVRRDPSPAEVDIRIVDGGALGAHKGINLPGVAVSAPCLTDKDLEDLEVGIRAGVDFVALSFVREATDVLTLREVLRRLEVPDLPVIAKIEKPQAVDNLADILPLVEGIMVARGDLGVEVRLERVPILQKELIAAANRAGVLVITATQMLDSMERNPSPTRAEITDVANAVFEQADAIMLSGETTVGRHPVTCIEVMDRIARRIERSGGANYHEEAELTQPRQKLVKSATLLADQLHARAIIAFTRSGQMARFAASLRPRHSAIFAICSDEILAGQLTLLRGVTPIIIPSCSDDPEGSIEGAIQRLLHRGFVKKGDTVVILVPHATTHDRQVDSLKMHVV